MTLSLPLSLFVRLLGVALLGSVALYGTSQSIHWLALLSLSLLATLAVLRKPNVFLYWPIGLLAVLVTMYGAYWWQWLSNPEGVDASSARTLFMILAILFAAVAVLRVLLHRDVVAVPPLARIITVAIMTALPVVLVYLVTSRWGDEPVRLIAGHLAGGDHGAHNEIVHRLLKVSENVSYASPLQMYTYPQAIHFMIANLIALTQSTSTVPLLAQEYAMGAWAEWLQFAAFCQLVIVVFMKGVRGSGLQRALLVPPLIFVFASMDSFVMHLLWSGFTTSLGMTWILLAFLAVSDRMHFGDSLLRSWLSFVSLGFFAYASWIVYQPYAVIFLALAGFFFIRIIATQKHLSRVLVPVADALERPVVMIIAVAGSIFIALIAVLGSQSPAVVSLLLDGATYKPYFYTVALWAFLAMAGHWLYSRQDDRFRLDAGQLKFLFVHFGFVAGMILTVMWAGGFGLLDQPYYTQKMLWTLLFVSLPVALSVGSTWLETIEFAWPINKRFGLFAAVVVALLLTPLVQGRLPVNATRKPTVDWFAKGMTVDVQNEDYRAVAFSWIDQLGSHVSNLALRATSDVVMPVDVALSNNTFIACRFINENNVNIIYAPQHGRAALITAGCSPKATYIEEDRVLENENPSYRPLTVGTERFISDDQKGIGHLLHGFLPVENWGVWAGGYQSIFGLRTTEEITDAVLRLRLETHRVFGKGIEVTLRVNGEVNQVLVMPQRGEVSVDLPLGNASRGEQFEISIECTRTDEQVLKDDPSDGPTPCVGLKSFLLVRGLS